MMQKYIYLYMMNLTFLTQNTIFKTISLILLSLVLVSHSSGFHTVAEWLRWLFAQLEGPVYVDGWEDRDDCCHSQEKNWGTG